MNFCYDSFEDNVLRGNIDLDNDTFYALLFGASYTPNQGAHQYRSDITGEVTGTGYTAGGVPVTVTLAKDTSAHKNTITFSAFNIPTATIANATGVAYYKRRGGLASADELVGQEAFPSPVSSTGGVFAVGAVTIALNTPSS